MKRKNNYDNLYVACQVYDYEIETEPFIQYESFGTIEHRIIINPKRKLIYSKIDENGNEKFYDYKTGEEVIEQSYEKSFKTNSSTWKSLYCSFIGGHTNIPIKALKDDFISEHQTKKRSVGYLIPATDYIKEKTRIDISLISPNIIDKIISILNIAQPKSFILSMYKDEATTQLEKIGYHKETSKKKTIG